MMRTEEVKIYKFDELSDNAKEKARDWYRQGNLDYDWWEYQYEWFETICGHLGIELNPKPVRLMNGSTRYDPEIYFSGFCSQGDGACFYGTYRYAKGWRDKLKGDCGESVKEVWEIAERLAAIQKRHSYQICCKIVKVYGAGNYCHSGTMTVDDVERQDGKEIHGHADLWEELKSCMRELADWMYGQLRAEYEYQQSDEVVEESIAANDYEFEEDGSFYT